MKAAFDVWMEYARLADSTPGSKLTIDAGDLLPVLMERLRDELAKDTRYHLAISDEARVR